MSNTTRQPRHMRVTDHATRCGAITGMVANTREREEVTCKTCLKSLAAEDDRADTLKVGCTVRRFGVRAKVTALHPRAYVPQAQIVGHDGGNRFDYAEALSSLQHDHKCTNHGGR